MFDFLNSVSIQQIEAQLGPTKPCNPQNEDDPAPRGRLESTSNDADRIMGDDEGNNIIGNDGDDCLVGFSGDDMIEGGEGNDILIGGDGMDLLDGGEGDEGRDTFYCDGTGLDEVVNYERNRDYPLLECP